MHSLFYSTCAASPSATALPPRSEACASTLASLPSPHIDSISAAAQRAPSFTRQSRYRANKYMRSRCVFLLHLRKCVQPPLALTEPPAVTAKQGPGYG